MDFTKIVEQCPLIITEGAILERLRREFPFKLDPHIAHAGFIYELKRRDLFKSIYKQYIDIVHTCNLPMIIFTPTWRANPERIKLAGLMDKNVNLDCFKFLSEIKKEYNEFSKSIFIGGLIGCKRDAYNPGEALTSEEAYVFHRFQVDALSSAGVDFLFAATLPALSEAIGLAKVMAGSGSSYIISFVIRPEGILLDGTPLNEAITVIDSSVYPRPLGYMVNCVHPKVFQSAIVNKDNSSTLVRKRIIGLQANTSSKSPEELDGSHELDTEEPNVFADLMVNLNVQFGTKILGGCCGTDHRHIKALIERICK